MRDVEHVTQSGPGDRHEALDLVEGAGNLVAFEENQREIALERYGRQRLTQQIVQIARDAQPLALDRELRQLGPRLTQLIDKAHQARGAEQATGAEDLKRSPVAERKRVLREREVGPGF